MVVGHGQISNCHDIVMESDDLNFPMVWVCESDASPDELMSVIENEILNSTKPLKISAIIWKNGIPCLSIDHAKKIIDRAECLLVAHPEHSIAFPEIMYLLKFKRYSEKVTKINKLLSDFNLKRG